MSFPGGTQRRIAAASSGGTSTVRPSILIRCGRVRKPPPESSGCSQKSPGPGAYDLILYNNGSDKNLASVHLELPDTMTVEEVDRLTRKKRPEKFSRSNFFRPAPHHFISGVIKRFGRTITTVLREFAGFPVILMPNSPSDS